MFRGFFAFWVLGEVRIVTTMGLKPSPSGESYRFYVLLDCGLALAFAARATELFRFRFAVSQQSVP